MTARKYLTLPFFILAPLALRAQLQDQYLKATLTLTDDREVVGYVRSLSDAAMNKGVPVKTSEGSSKVIYRSDSIKHLVFENGAIFQRLVFAASFEDRKAVALGRLIVEGRLSLYHISYRQTDYFLLVNPENTFVLQNDKLDKLEVIKHFWRNNLVAATGDVPQLRDRAMNVSFAEKSLADFVMDYNKAAGYASRVVKPSFEKANFLIGFVNVAMDSKEPELFIQVAYRHYVPRISHALSLNAGFNYIDYRHIEAINYAPTPSTRFHHERISGQVYSIPAYLQQNVLNGRIRPYILGGLNLSMFVENDQYHQITQDRGFQKSYGINYLLGAGIELNVTKNIILKSEYHFEILSHPLFVGIGFCLPRL